MFFPSLLKLYGSNEKPPHRIDSEGDESPVLILQGDTRNRRVSMENPAAGPDGVPLIALYHQDGTRLATWIDK